MEAETLTALAALRERDTWERARGVIEKRWFTLSKYSNIWQVICDCHEEDVGEVIPSRDLSLRLRGKKGHGLVNEMIRIRKRTSSSTLHRNLQLWIEGRLMEDVYENMTASAEEGKPFDHTKLMEIIEQIQTVKYVAGDSVSFLDTDPWEFLKQRQTEGDIAYPIEGLNGFLDGGLSHSQLCTVLAPTDAGKTTFCINVARHAIEMGKHVLHASFETTKEELHQRYLCSFCNRPLTWLETHPLSLREHMKKIKEKGGILRIEDFSYRHASTSDIQAVIQKMQKQKGVDLVVVDSGDDVVSTKKSDSIVVEQKQVWLELRRIARKYYIPVLVTTQTNRQGAASSNPQLTDIGGSYGKATITDCMLLLQSVKDLDIGSVKIVKTKRGGRYPEINFTLDRKRCRIS